MAPTIQKRRPTRKGPAPAAKQACHAAPAAGLQCDAATQVVMGMARRDPGVWFETYGRIVNKDGVLEKPRINTLQRRVLETWLYCQERGLPCSIILCKPRQKGSSTWATSLCYHICRTSTKETRACIIGGLDKQVDSLWNILDTLAQNDACVWGNGTAEVQADKAMLGKGLILRETAGNPEAGRAHTFRVGIITELARWRNNGVRNAAKVLSGFLACCPRRPGTLRIIESTAQGIGGEFHSRYWKALPLREFLAGRRNTSGFVRIFAAWYEFPDSWVDLDPDEKELLEADLSDEEREMRARYDLDLEQLAWRRETIEAECDGDPDKFKQEYPANENEAFLSSGRPRFNRAGLEKQSDLAKGSAETISSGDLAISPDWKVSWLSQPDEECVLHRYESPQEGRQYLLVVDPMTGATQAMGLDPDCHSVLVIRRGYYDEQGHWMPPALAMRIHPPRKDYKFACRWDADVLEEMIYRMAIYYGNCRVVVEMNKDIGITELLKTRTQTAGAPVPNLYRRPVWNEREKRETKALGWMTTTGNREALVNTLAAAIRETGEEGGGVELRCAHSIAECLHFEIGDRGSSNAAAGWHDDDVLAWAIGLTCIEQATTYHEPRVQRVDPPEVRKLMGASKKRPGMYS